MNRPRKLSNCLICNSNEKLTAEHVLPSSLLEKFHQKEKDDTGILKFLKKDGEQCFSNIKKCKTLKPVKNLCEKCNTSRSTDCDMYFNEFVWKMFEWGKETRSVLNLKFPTNDEVRNKREYLSKNGIKDFNGLLEEEQILQSIIDCAEFLIVKPSNSTNFNLLNKYLTKHSICFLERAGVNIPSVMQEAFLNNGPFDFLKVDYYLANPRFRFGYSNSVFVIRKNEYSYKLIFSNLLINISIKHDSIS